VTPPSDEEVARYYEDNKEFLCGKDPPKDTEKLDSDKPDSDPKT